MKNPYQNEHLKAQVQKNMFAARFLIIMELFGFFLCFLSFFNTYNDIYRSTDIHFGDLFGMLDDSFYTIEITEMPEELYPSFYMVKIGDNALMVTGIDEELEKLERKGSIKVRGQLRGYSAEEEDISQAAWDYYSRYGYYADDPMTKGRVAGHCLQRSDASFIKMLCEDHPLGLVFGLTILIVNSMIMSWEGTLYMFRHLHPACGSVRFSPKDLDEQAERPGSEWFEGMGLYFTPEILIGTQRGMAAVRYDDIDKIRIRKRWHINWATAPNSARIKSGSKYNLELMLWANSDKSEYYSYQMIVKSKNHRRLLMCDAKYNISQEVIDRINEIGIPLILPVEREDGKK